ncbi:hypothetical protein MNBD_ALPHA08-379 [hydrothermal vent metagenome]|uniref:M23ase beta-sheet core domain-containing protein n=1 Tax=hydrothermal vent metagenome TaxID=652676 RepID=A0A3B0RRZ2_9ZZZZ
MRKRSNQHRQLRPRGLFGHVAHFFRERQIYVRSKGEVQFITIRPYVMVIGLFVLMTGFFWIAFASINVTFKDQLIAVKERNLYQNRLDQEERVSDLRKTIDGLNEKLMLDQKGYLQEVDKLRVEYNSLVGQQKKLAEFFRQGWLPVKNQPVSSPSSPTSPANSQSPVSPPNNQGKQDFSPVRSDKSSFNQFSLGQRYAAQFTTRRQALQPLEDVRNEMRAFADLQERLLDEVIIYAQKQNGKAKKLFSRLGVNPDAVLKVSKLTTADSVGGPFVSPTSDDVFSPRVAARLEKAVLELDRAKLLQQQAKKLPLALPVDKVTRITSRYGLRRDPFRKVAAMHTGIDIKAPYGAPVRTTADGIVLSAGWAGGYGRRVVVRHKNGIVTRYAHMSRLLVKKGQVIKVGTKVGLIGSSGRSTGAHVHYETRLNGRVMNPARFWKARNDFQTLSE